MKITAYYDRSNNKTPLVMSRVLVFGSKQSWERAYRMTVLSSSNNPPSSSFVPYGVLLHPIGHNCTLTIALKRDDMRSWACSMVNSKTMGRQESSTPSRPNWIMKPAVINDGDIQHFLGKEPLTRGVLLPKESQKQRRLA